MGTGEYLTDDGDGEAAIRELAVRSVEIGAEASGVPGWMLYEREPYVRDCRSIYKTGNLVANAGLIYVLDEPIEEDVLLGRISSRVEADGWSVQTIEARDREVPAGKLLQAENGYESFGVLPMLNSDGLVHEFRVDTSTVCVKPDGEIIDDFRSR